MLLASAPTSASSTHFRGTMIQQDELSLNRHRHLREESSCTLFLIISEFVEDHPNEHGEKSWTCEFSKHDAERLDVQSVDIVESSSVAAILENATSGASILTMSEAVIDTDTQEMYIPENAHVEVHDTFFGPDGAHKTAVAPTGKLNVLMIRVIDKNNIEPDSSVAQLKNDIFDDSVCLKTQMEACSYGKLKIHPFEGKSPNEKEYISNGIVNVQMDYDITSSINPRSIINEARKAAGKQLGDLKDPRFDLIMFCFPPGAPFYHAASAILNGRQSYYPNDRCGPVSAQMHEVGHNLGLDHSGTHNKPYGDTTGFMGSTNAMDDQRKCYNPQKSYQLEWYADKTDTINPLDGVGNRKFTLNGVSDYKRNNDALIVLRLEQLDVVQDYYVGFNRAEGINEDSNDDKDMVTIIRKKEKGPYETSESTKVASLMPGDLHTINNFNGQKDVKIKFLELKNGDARIEIIAPSSPVAPPSPTKAPTKAPTAMPTPTPPCEKYTLEVRTDKFPDDTSWKIVDKFNEELIVDERSKYGGKETLYTDTVCLTGGKTYKLRLLDTYGDGICCSQGDGYFRLIDSCGNVIVDSGNFSSEFKEKEYNIETKVNKLCPTKNPTNAPTKAPVSSSDDECKDEKKEKEKFRIKEDGQNNNCKFYNKRSKCDETILTGDEKNKLVWEVCKKSCNRCSGSSPDPDPDGAIDDECKDVKKEKQKFRIKEDGKKNNCSFYTKRNKCNEKILTGKNKNRLVWELCENSCNRCGA